MTTILIGTAILAVIILLMFLIDRGTANTIDLAALKLLNISSRLRARRAAYDARIAARLEQEVRL